MTQQDSILAEFDDIVIGKYGDDDDLWCKEGARVLREWLPIAFKRHALKAQRDRLDIVDKEMRTANVPPLHPNVYFQILRAEVDRLNKELEALK